MTITTKNAQALKARVLEELAALADGVDPSEFTEAGPDGVSRLRPEVWADPKKRRAACSLEVSRRGVKVQVPTKASDKALRLLKQ